MSDLSRLVGRSQISPVVRAMDDPGPSARVDAIAHVFCVMGGHIPHQNNERADACSFHRRQAVVALARLDATEPSTGSVIPSRRSDPSTSRDAEPTPVRAGTQRAALLAAFALPAAADGLTDEEAADLAVGVPYRSEFSKRCSELRAAGLIETTGGTRKGVAGHERIVCRITDRGRTVVGGL